jgi:hypothetical protein
VWPGPCPADFLPAALHKTHAGSFRIDKARCCALRKASQSQGRLAAHLRWPEPHSACLPSLHNPTPPTSRPVHAAAGQLIGGVWFCELGKEVLWGVVYQERARHTPLALASFAQRTTLRLVNTRGAHPVVLHVSFCQGAPGREVAARCSDSLRPGAGARRRGAAGASPRSAPCSRTGAAWGTRARWRSAARAGGTREVGTLRCKGAYAASHIVWDACMVGVPA